MRNQSNHMKIGTKNTESAGMIPKSVKMLLKTTITVNHRAIQKQMQRAKYVNFFAFENASIDSDLLFNWLVVTVQVDCESAQTYKVTAELVDSSDNMLTSSTIFNVTVIGLNNFELLFDGETLYNNGVNGPYNHQS